MKAIITTGTGFTFNHYMRCGIAHFIRNMRIYRRSGYLIKIIKP